MNARPPRTLVVLTLGLVGGWALTASRAQPTAPMAEPTETAAAEAEQASESPLATLDWMVGTWVGETENGRVEFSCRFTKNDAFMIRAFRIFQEEEVVISGMQVVAWDPAEGTIRSWTYDSDGGFGEDTWSQADDHYTMRTKYTLADGGVASALSYLKCLDENTFVRKSTNREIDGQLQPDTPQVVLTRVVAE